MLRPRPPPGTANPIDRQSASLPIPGKVDSPARPLRQGAPRGIFPGEGLPEGSFPGDFSASPMSGCRNHATVATIGDLDPPIGRV